MQNPTTPYEYGQRAHAIGINAPAMDIDFLATLPKGPVGTTIPAMKEWHRGWTEANLSEPCPAIDEYTATYSPEDNKLRLRSLYRLDKETYARVRAAGFIYAPKQELFVAPAWTPEREDLLLELCGEIGDEDTSLVERAQVRAERFTDYKHKRAQDAARVRAGVEAIASGIPFGQPILVGHHSERRARKDAERIEDGMRKALRMWETSEYWQQRAAGAIHAAKYKERPDVRARRIKTLEADKRRHERDMKRAQDAARVRAGVEAIASGIPFGQPILVGHHSERRARKDAERIEDGMRKALRMWETSEYWQQRAAGAIHAAKYKERPDVRARRIKTLEADKRRHERDMKRAELFVRVWTAPGLDMKRALLIASRDWGFWSDLDSGKITPEEACEKATAKHRRAIEYAARFIAHLENRLTYEKAMLDESGYTPPAKPKTSAALPLLNYPGTVAYRNPYHRSEIITGEAHHMTKAEFSAINQDYKSTRVSECGTHRVRTAMLHNPTRLVAVYLTDSKQHPRPCANEIEAKAQEEEAAATRRLEAETRRLVARADVNEQQRQQREIHEQDAAPFRQLKENLKQGVLPVAAPQLFPTPPALARRMVELAEIEPGHRVLEPSAGTGNLLRAIGDQPDKVAVEFNRSLAQGLLNLGVSGLHVRNADFLDPEQTDDLGQFDRVVMNPPFVNAQDVAHIKRALAMLKPGGRLVALCANGPRQQEALRPLADTWEELPAGTFDGTGVRAALLSVRT